MELDLLQTVQDLASKQLPDPSFVIPTLPRGRHVTIQILSTWGDPHYVGLSGFELFNQNGAFIPIDPIKNKISSQPRSLNDLDEYSTDPRTIDKLFDGVNATCSELHTWLAPFTPGQNHVIHIDLGEECVLGCFRIWNYNTSRIHTARGVRDVIIQLSDVVIFQGEIQQAPGSAYEAPLYAENILFTN